MARRWVPRAMPPVLPLPRGVIDRVVAAVVIGVERRWPWTRVDLCGRHPPAVPRSCFLPMRLTRYVTAMLYLHGCESKMITLAGAWHLRYSLRSLMRWTMQVPGPWPQPQILPLRCSCLDLPPLFPLRLSISLNACPPSSRYFIGPPNIHDWKNTNGYFCSRYFFAAFSAFSLHLWRYLYLNSLTKSLQPHTSHHLLPRCNYSLTDILLLALRDAIGIIIQP